MRGDRDGAGGDLSLAPGFAADLHCHLLPGIDDGARDLEDAISMARQAAADGIEAICATPHIRHDHDVRIAELPGRRAELADALAARGIPVRVLAGGEVAEPAVGGLDDAELDAVALGGGRWILLEPRPGPLGDELAAAVDALGARGFGAIVAHPERHADEAIAARLAELADRGALVQVTAEYLTRAATARLLLELAGSGLVHLLGTDAHSSRAGRPVRLSPALERLGAVDRLRDHLGWIARDGPSAVLGGGPVRPPF
ncbi:MAG TPA: CpsB/CapC family capsule biosynthesis tyrosine phosphatase [Solirubrobacterales bacterium]